MRVMAIDYGDSRTGVAFSDLSGTLVGETLVLKANGPRAAQRQLIDLIAQRKPDRIALGNPLNMDGSAGARSQRSHELKKILEDSTGVRCDLWDERRTTIDAHRILSDADVHGRQRKNTVDAVAASLILEGYLAAMKNGKV